MLSCSDADDLRSFEVGRDPYLVAAGSVNGVCRVFLHDDARGENVHDKRPCQNGLRTVWRPSETPIGGAVFGRQRPQRLAPLWRIEGASRIAAVRWHINQGRRLLAVGFFGGCSSRATVKMCVKPFCFPARPSCTRSRSFQSVCVPCACALSKIRAQKRLN